MRSFEERFASLEEAALSLGEDVRSLVATIQVVNELQIQQREQQIKQARIEEAVRKQKIEVDQRDARTRKVLRTVTISLAILLPLVSILVYAALIVHVNNLIDANKATSYASCKLRNETQLQNAQRERLLAQYETNPKIKAVHVQSAQQLETTLADCSKWAPSK